MCGITLHLRRKDASDALSAEAWDALCLSNASRGPDFNRTLTLTCGDDGLVSFAASVLHMRGSKPTEQPHTSDTGDVLCWNGEIFDGLEIPAEGNDGSSLFIALTAATTSEELVDVLSRVEGPYAFTFYSARETALYFARDPLGRRSLLARLPSPTSSSLILSSTSAGPSMTPALEELSSEVVFRLDLKSHFSRDGQVAALDKLQRLRDCPGSFATSLTLNNILPPDDLPATTLSPLSVELFNAIGQLLEVLDTSVKLRVQHVPPQPLVGDATTSTPPARIAVLFSGGLDCTIVATLANKYAPSNEPIDLLNVAFENPRKLLAQSRQSKPKGKSNSKNAASASMADQTNLDAGTPSAYAAPDRLTGLEQVEELRRLMPDRQWNFVEVDVPYSETQGTRPLVEQLMLPSQSIMDLSLALALYFASRGRGHVRDDAGQPRPYQSRARVVLSGLGADELLGGYSRHKKAFQTGGWQSLVQELQLDLTRLPTRNLGRDDRIISSHGKEARYPFLSLSVVAFLAGLEVHFKLDPRLGDGLGDKMLLRLAAKKLGLELASGRRKRAMQFGSQSARMEEGASRRGDVALDAQVEHGTMT